MGKKEKEGIFFSLGALGTGATLSKKTFEAVCLGRRKGGVCLDGSKKGEFWGRSVPGKTGDVGLQAGETGEGPAL